MSQELYSIGFVTCFLTRIKTNGLYTTLYTKNWCQQFLNNDYNDFNRPFEESLVLIRNNSFSSQKNQEWRSYVEFISWNEKKLMRNEK